MSLQHSVQYPKQLLPQGRLTWDFTFIHGVVSIWKELRKAPRIAILESVLAPSANGYMNIMAALIFLLHMSIQIKFQTFG